MLALLFRMSILAIIGSVTIPLTSSTVHAQTLPTKGSKTETWFGWIDSPEQQLRTVVRIQRDDQNKPMTATILSPDQSMDDLPLSDLKIDGGEWYFNLNNPTTAKLSASYLGKQTSPKRVEGELVQSGKKLPLNFDRLESFPIENRTTLGADAVWQGTLDLVVQKLDLRLRVYSKPPFATSEQPRILFDSITQNGIGIPAIATVDANKNPKFEMKSISATYTATLNEAGNELNGRFSQGPLPIPLTMKLLVDESVPLPTVPIDARSTGRKKDLDRNGPNAEKPNEKGPKMVENEFFTETEFQVTHSIIRQRSKEKNVPAKEVGITLTGTITIPRLKGADKSAGYPAVVMVSGSGPQDRNETIGKHKPFEVIAHFLAENGIASLRYDDRGVGESTGNFLIATTEDFAKDAVAVWKHAKTLPNIDPDRLGLLGHSEGGMIGPMAASWEPGIAFLILLAPPGITGSDLLSSQIDRMSELLGMSEENRISTMGLQQELQRIASGYVADESSMKLAIRSAINKNWDGLKQLALAQDPLSDMDEIKKNLTKSIEQQFQQLRMPWYRFFLGYDPSTNWMLIRCPTLAIWGSNDVQVLPEINQAKIQKAVARNVELDSTLEILPGLNHLFQTSKTGLPDEYEQINETISPKALNIIRSWAQKRGFAGVT